MHNSRECRDDRKMPSTRLRWSRRNDRGRRGSASTGKAMAQRKTSTCRRFRPRRLIARGVQANGRRAVWRYAQRPPAASLKDGPWQRGELANQGPSGTNGPWDDRPAVIDSSTGTKQPRDIFNSPECPPGAKADMKLWYREDHR